MDVSYLQRERDDAQKESGVTDGHAARCVCVRSTLIGNGSVAAVDVGRFGLVDRSVE